MLTLSRDHSIRLLEVPSLRSRNASQIHEYGCSDFCPSGRHVRLRGTVRPAAVCNRRLHCTPRYSLVFARSWASVTDVPVQLVSGRAYQCSGGCNRRRCRRSDGGDALARSFPPFHALYRPSFRAECDRDGARGVGVCSTIASAVCFVRSRTADRRGRLVVSIQWCPSRLLKRASF